MTYASKSEDDSRRRLCRVATMIAAIGLICVPPALAASLASTRPADADLYVAVEGAIFADGGVSADQVEVAVKGGVVTLSGAVDSLLAKRRAVSLAEAVPGVRSVVDLQTVHPVQRSDAGVVRDVEASLAGDPATSGWRIDVSCIRGDVTLGGTVDSYAERQLAGMLASGVVGVAEVSNDIAVALPRTRPDAEIKADIEQRLRWNAWLGDYPIAVAVSHGRVTLSGKVARVSDQRRAERLARVDGVVSVDDKTSLDWPGADAGFPSPVPPQHRDQSTAAAIKAAFHDDPRLRALAPTVAVADGEVTLSGPVDSYAARKAAYQDAEDTVGVTGINNFIKIRPREQPADSAISRSVTEALARDVYLFDANIAVSVHDGNVLLRGVVQNAYQLRHAAVLAGRSIGVHSVTNELTILQQPRKRRDADIISGIRRDFAMTRDLRSAPITVAVADGIAMLTGTVPSLHADQEAQAIAYENGAITVNDLLQIGPL